MTSLQQAKKIYEKCVHASKEGQFLTYRDVLDHLGYGQRVAGHAIRYGLELAWIACAHMAMPILTSIIVNQSSGKPSEDGYPVSNWKEDAKKVFAHKKWPSSDEIDWDYVWNNRARLSDKHATRGYWNKS